MIETEEKAKTKFNPKKLIPVVAVLVIAVAVKIIFFPSPFYYAGTIEATKVDIPARVTSVISSRDVNEGDHVQENQPLMHLACEDYRLEDELATENFERADKLYKQGSQSKESYDQLKNHKEDSDLKVSWCTILSPMAGTVLNKYHEKGEIVTPGMRLFTLANIKDIYAYIYLPQPKVAELKMNEKLLGILPEMKGRVFSGTIVHINEEAEFTPKNVQTEEERTRLVFGVKVAFENNDETLKPGMTIEVKVP